MSGFDPAWLDLREPADARARSRRVLGAVAAAFSGRAQVSVVDLASGSGSTLRALAPLLGCRQRWTLVDHDRALLAHARDRLAGWSDAAETAGDEMRLRRGSAAIEVAFEVRDLSNDPLPGCAAGADLATASALFDLVGPVWLARFVARLAAARKPLYAALTYDGRKRFAPQLPLDGFAVSAFDRHQRSDKGLGPALGPAAHEALRARLMEVGYRVVEGDGSWRLGPGDRSLATALIEGVARAAAEASGHPPALVAWRDERVDLAAAGSVDVGHRDLFAVPA